MRIYCDTATLLSNVQRHDMADGRRELSALRKLLMFQREGKLIMYRSAVVGRELENTRDQVQLERLRSDYYQLQPVAKDERVVSFHNDNSSPGGSTCCPLVSDVQDEALRRELLLHGVDFRDAEHLTQAVCNECDVFLTRDEDTIIKPHRAWLEARFPKMRVRLPSELLADLTGEGLLCTQAP